MKPSPAVNMISDVSSGLDGEEISSHVSKDDQRFNSNLVSNDSIQ